MTLPNVGEDFPHPRLSGSLSVGQQTRRGRDDGDTESTEDLRHARARVDLKTGLLTRRRPAMERLAVGAVLRSTISLTDGCFFCADACNVSLLNEDLRDAFFNL